MNAEYGRRIAVISDVHSNSFALEAVLDDIRMRGVDQIINLGDSLYGPIDPAGTFHLLNDPSIISISGNQDREILEWIHRDSSNPTLEFVKSELSSDAIAWLRKLPFDLTLSDGIYCCHGTAISDEEYLLEEITEDQVTIRNASEVLYILRHIDSKIVCCGHSHVPGFHYYDDKLIINAGSVGLQAYDDDLPFYHKMENKSPEARYVLLSMHTSTITTEIVSVEYDYETAALRSELNGRSDWASFIRTGLVNSK